MNPNDLSADYFANVADLEGSLDLPVLGRLEADGRFYERSEGLVGLAPDPRLSARLYNFVQSEAPAVWVVGLGDGGVELPVAVGIAEQCAAAGVRPTLLAGPEHRRPPGMSAEGLRPVAPGHFETTLAPLFASDCGAQASGIQGVCRVWPGSDPQSAAIEPQALIVASHWATEELRPPVEGVSGVVLVVPFRDEPAREITDRVTMFRSMGYPLMGMVALTVAGESEAAPQDAAIPANQDPERRDARMDTNGGGSMDGESRETQGAGEEAMGNPGSRRPEEEAADAPVETESQTAESSDPFAAMDADEIPEPEFPGGEMAADGEPATEEVPVQTAWSDAYGPRGRLAGRHRSRTPWWMVVVLLIIVAAAAIVVRGRLGGKDGDDLVTDSFRMDQTSELAPLDPVDRDRDAADLDRQLEPATDPAVETPTTTPEVADRSPNARPDTTPIEPPATTTTQTPARQPVERVAEAPAPTAEPITGGESFGVLCGSFRTMDRAAAEVNRLQGLGLVARVVTVEIPAKGTWNRVVVGQWAGDAAARTEARRIVEAGHVKTAMLVAEDGYGRPIGPPLEKGAGR